jgi:hypothetical protein
MQKNRDRRGQKRLKLHTLIVPLIYTKKNRGQEGTEKAETSSKNRPLMQKNRVQEETEKAETSAKNRPLVQKSCRKIGGR